MAFPMPEDDPVTRAVRPCRSFCPFTTMLFKQPAAPTGFGPWVKGCVVLQDALNVAAACNQAQTNAK